MLLAIGCAERNPGPAEGLQLRRRLVKVRELEVSIHSLVQPPTLLVVLLVAECLHLIRVFDCVLQRRMTLLVISCTNCTSNVRLGPSTLKPRPFVHLTNTAGQSCLLGQAPHPYCRVAVSTAFVTTSKSILAASQAPFLMIRNRTLICTSDKSCYALAAISPEIGAIGSEDMFLSTRELTGYPPPRRLSPQNPKWPSLLLGGLHRVMEVERWVSRLSNCPSAPCCFTERSWFLGRVCLIKRLI